MTLLRTIAITIAALCVSNASAMSSSTKPSMPASTSTSTSAKQTTILFLGDSLTEGYQLSREEAYPGLIEAELKAKGQKNIRIINAGISGSTSASALGRLRWQLKGKDKPDIMVLALGANDGLRGFDIKPSRQQLESTIRLAKENGITVLLAGMKIPPNYGVQYAREFEQMYTSLAKQEDVALIPFLLDGVAGEPKLNLPDGIHPNAEGYKIVARNVLKHLEPLLEQHK